MNSRDRQILKALLDVLHQMDGGQLVESVLHAEVNLRISPNATLGEFESARDVADQRGFINGVTPRLGGGRKWNITDAGTAARSELKH